MTGNVRYWILLLSILAIVFLLGNLLLLNVLLVYPHANHLLPVQYKVNSTILANNTHSVQKRSIGAQSNSNQQTAQRPPAPYQQTTAHPIPLAGPFLETSPTKPPPRTRRTLRPALANRPVTILTNPNIPVETTTFARRRSVPPQTIDKNNEQPINKSVSALEKPPKADNLPAVNVTNQTKSTLFDRDWLQFLQEAMLFSSPGLGMLVGYAPLSYWLRKTGSRKVIGTCLAFSAFFVIVQLNAISFGLLYTCIFRFFHGFTCAPVLAFIGVNAAQWATLKEQLIFLAVSFSAILFAPAFHWFLVYKLIDAYQLSHLRILHYVLGGLTVALSLLWLAFYRDSPQEHRLANGVELNRIATGKTRANRIGEHSVLPLLLKSVSTWSLTIASFAYFSAFAFMANFLPIYLVTVLQTDHLCTLTSLTFVAPISVHLLCPLLNKPFGSCCSSSLLIRIFNSVGFVLTAVFFLVLAALPPDYSFVGTNRAILTIILVPLGFSTLGFIYSSIIYGRYFTQYIVCNMEAPFAFAMALVPLSVVFLTVDNALRYWRLAFLIMAALMIVSCVVFALLVQGQSASWAENTWDPSSSHKMHNIEYIARGEECGLLEMRRLDDRAETTNTDPKSTV